MICNQVSSGSENRMSVEETNAPSKDANRALERAVTLSEAEKRR